MIEVISPKTLLESPRYGEGRYYDFRTHWTRPDLVALKAFTQLRSNIEKCADALGRPPETLVDRAYKSHLPVPSAWLEFYPPAMRSKAKAGNVKARQPLLHYPYIKQARGEHQDLLDVNALLPRSLPEHWRADACQEMMLYICEGRITVEDLRRSPKLVRQFIRKVARYNHEAGGYAISLDYPMKDGRSWYDVLPQSRGAEFSSFEELGMALGVT